MSKEHRVIYGGGPVFGKLGTATMIALLHDEVILVGPNDFESHLQELDCQDRPGERTSIDRIKKMNRVLWEEGVLSYHDYDRVRKLYPSSERIEIDVECEQVNLEGRSSVVMRFGSDGEVERYLQGKIGSGITVSSFIRELTAVSVASFAAIPIVNDTDSAMFPGRIGRAEHAAAVFAMQALRRLALPELLAYEPDDILDARRKLRSELLEFRDGVRELVWHIDSARNAGVGSLQFTDEINWIIDTKVAASLSRFERAMASHESGRVRRMMLLSAGALVEIGKAASGLDISQLFIGFGAAGSRAASALEAKGPEVCVSSFIYRVRDMKF